MAEKKAARPRRAAPTHAKNADLTAHKQRFVAWLCSEDKQPMTQRELALDLGVDAATLSDWKRDPLVVGLLRRVDDSIVADRARATANLWRIATQTRDAMAAIAAYDKLAKTHGWYVPDRHEISGKMTLADFLAAGGYSAEETTERRAWVN